MMNFAILFEDDPAHSDKRQQYMSDHLAFLKRNAGRISAAGPLRDGTNGAAAGGLWIVQADNYQDAKALSEEDPLFATGLRRKITILEWKQVFADGTVLIGLKSASA
jgi:uncharacterized protein YciI